MLVTHRILIVSSLLLTMVTRAATLAQAAKRTRLSTSAAGAAADATSATATATASSSIRTALEESGASGEFVRKEASWRNWVKNGTF
jgi:hypothetical protein